MKRPPPFLFRYRPPSEVSLGYLEGLLSENHIYASLPEGFTDEHDCRPRIEFDRPKAEWLQYWLQAFEKLGLKGKEISRKAHSAMATGTWRKPGKHAEIGRLIQETLDKSGVICLTDTALDKEMWAGYAEHHRGICLCFESSESPFAFTQVVTYVPELPTMRFNADIEDLGNAFLRTKQSSYAWEREWRYVDYNKGGGYKPIAPSALRAIVFGSQAEEEMKQRVIRLVSNWKPGVLLFAVDALEGEDSELRLRLLDEPRASSTARIIPPIQERSRNEPVWRPYPVRLLDYLGSISPEDRRQSLDGRIEGLASRLNIVDSFAHLLDNEGTTTVPGGIPSPQEMINQDDLGNGIARVLPVWSAALQEATNLVRELVDRSGSAIPGYGEVSVLLYQIVCARASSSLRS